MTLRAAAAGAVDLFQLHRANPRRYPFLLQSVAEHPVAARYDLLFAYPGETLELPKHGKPGGRDFFAALSEWSAREAQPRAHADLPFEGGWFVLLGYEAARCIEPRVALPASPHALPDALAVRCPAAIVYDRSRQVAHLIAERAAQLEGLRSDLAAHASAPPPAPCRATQLIEEPADRFLAGVRRIHEYLRAGDVFQVNLSRAWRATLERGCDYQNLYAGLRQSNPAPFAGLAFWEGTAVLSSSPERLVRIADRKVETRPIAGTLPRAGNDDEVQRHALLGSLKERAEHVMLIDLERNDLGRVCEPGSVSVGELMAVESYAHVHHIVSNVEGRLRAQTGPGEVLRAVFPGGTITGCPKVRAMEIIAELEGEGRGPYTGAMGYLARDGRLDMNILIRTLVCRGGEASFRAGAGIVADSIPERELEETRAKARGMLLALGAA